MHVVIAWLGHYNLLNWDRVGSFSDFHSPRNRAREPAGWLAMEKLPNDACMANFFPVSSWPWFFAGGNKMAALGFTHALTHTLTCFDAEFLSSQAFSHSRWELRTVMDVCACVRVREWRQCCHLVFSASSCVHTREKELSFLFFLHATNSCRLVGFRLVAHSVACVFECMCACE